jgi:hypothetical protein
MKTWEKPKLVVLLRGKPEEAVLETCKSAGQSGPGITYAGCALTVGALCPGSFEPIACQEGRPS